MQFLGLTVTRSENGSNKKVVSRLDTLLRLIGTNIQELETKAKKHIKDSEAELANLRTSCEQITAKANKTYAEENTKAEAEYQAVVVKAEQERKAALGRAETGLKLDQAQVAEAQRAASSKESKNQEILAALSALGLN